jgi:hypothetical protein
MSGILIANALYYGTFIAINVLKKIYDSSHAVQGVNQNLVNTLLTQSKLGEAIQNIANITTAHDVRKLMNNITTASGLLLTEAIINSGGNKTLFDQKLPDTCLNVAKEIYKVMFQSPGSWLSGPSQVGSSQGPSQVGSSQGPSQVGSSELTGLTVDRPDKDEILQNLTQVCIDAVQDSMSSSVEKSIFKVGGRSVNSMYDRLNDNIHKAYENFKDAERNAQNLYRKSTNWSSWTNWANWADWKVSRTDANLFSSEFETEPGHIELHTSSITMWKSYIIFLGLILFLLLPVVVYFYQKYLKSKKEQVSESELDLISEETRKLIKEELKHNLLHTPAPSTPSILKTSPKRLQSPKQQVYRSRPQSRRIRQKSSLRRRRSRYLQKYRQIRSTV